MVQIVEEHKQLLVFVHREHWLLNDLDRLTDFSGVFMIGFIFNHRHPKKQFEIGKLTSPKKK